MLMRFSYWTVVLRDIVEYSLISDDRERTGISFIKNTDDMTTREETSP